MKLSFIFFLLLINFLSKSSFSSEKNNQKIIILEDDSKKSVEEKDLNERKIHIVKKGDTLFSISRMYSLDKKIIIQINDLKNENHIFVGQTLKLNINKPVKLNDQNKNIPKYHKILEGENLTEISSKYGLNIKDLINLNKIDNPDNIDVGTNLLLINPSKVIKQKGLAISNISNRNLLDLKKYGPLTLESTEFKIVGGRKTLNVIYKNKTKLILSLNCESKEIDVRKKGRKWKGWIPVRENFEERLMNDFC